jgi:hypothetical protein
MVLSTAERLTCSVRNNKEVRDSSSTVDADVGLPITECLRHCAPRPSMAKRAGLRTSTTRATISALLRTRPHSGTPNPVRCFPILPTVARSHGFSKEDGTRVQTHTRARAHTNTHTRRAPLGRGKWCPRRTYVGRALAGRTVSHVGGTPSLIRPIPPTHQAPPLRSAPVPSRIPHVTAALVFVSIPTGRPSNSCWKPKSVGWKR